MERGASRRSTSRNERSRLIDPDDGANRYDAAWSGANDIVAVSDKGGIANIIQMNLASREIRTLSGVTGAAVAPEPNPSDGSVWFLSLYSRGYDLRRLTPTSDDERSARRRDRAPRAGAVRLHRSRSSSPTNAVSEPRRFGFTPRLFRWIPQPSLDADGASAALALVSRDVIGRSEVLLAGAYGDAASWRGGTLSGMWAGWGAGVARHAVQRDAVAERESRVILARARISTQRSSAAQLTRGSRRAVRHLVVRGRARRQRRAELAIPSSRSTRSRGTGYTRVLFSRCSASPRRSAGTRRV